MAPIILSARLRGDLEDLVLRTPSAKQRCRAQAVLWLAEGLSAEQVAETFQVSRQTVYNWVNRFLRRDDLELRARLLDAPRPGRPPSIAEVIDPLIAAAFAGDPRESGYHATVWDRRVAAAPLGARSWDQGLRQEHQRGDRTPGSPLETAPA
jgi:transposase-like protein